MDCHSSIPHPYGGDAAMLRLVAGQLPGIAWSTDPQLRVQCCFGGGLAGLDISAERAVGMTLADFFQTQDPKHPLIEAHDGALRGESVVCRDLWQGQPFHFSVRPLYDQERRIVGCVGLARRMYRLSTEREMPGPRSADVMAAINQVLRQSLVCKSDEEIARVCLDVALELTGSTFGFIGEVNRRGRFRTIVQSDMFWEACRIPESQAIRMVRDMQIRGIWGRVLASGRPLIVNDPASYPDSVGTPEGRPPLTHFLGVPIKQEERTTGMIALANKKSEYDLNDQRAIEAMAVPFAAAFSQRRADMKIRRLNRHLEYRVAERTRDLEQFAYSVSHDLRAPLRAISGFAEIVASRHRANLNEEGQRYVDNVVKAAFQMDRLINDLLRYLRMGRAAVRRENVPLGDVLEEVAHNVAPRLAASGGHLEMPDDLPVVVGDRSLLAQVFTNLIENGLTYHQRGTPPRVKLECRVEGGEVVVCVEDEGIGIDPRYHDKVFAIFQRLHSEEEYPGTGVGLAIVEKAVGLLRGTIGLESEPGKGSVFSVRLQRSPDCIE